MDHAERVFPQHRRHKHNEASGIMARELAQTGACVASGDAKKKAKILFAHPRRIMRLDRLRLRGPPDGAKDEFLLVVTVQNLRKLTKLLPMTSAVPSSSTSVTARANRRKNGHRIGF